MRVRSFSVRCFAILTDVNMLDDRNTNDNIDAMVTMVMMMMMMMMCSKFQCSMLDKSDRC